MELFDPVAGVRDEIFPDWRGVLPVEIDGIAPFIFIFEAEIIGGELPHIISVGTEMVVNDVENHAQTESMRAINEMAEIIRPAVKSSGSEHVHPVVPPAEF